MRTLVYFEVLAASEHLAAAVKRAVERLLAGVDADVVHQLVLGLKRLAQAGAAVPVARVVRLFRSADVVSGQMGDGLVRRREHLVAEGQRRGGAAAAAAAAGESLPERIDPEADLRLLVVDAHRRNSRASTAAGAGARRTVEVTQERVDGGGGRGTARVRTAADVYEALYGRMMRMMVRVERRSRVTEGGRGGEGSTARHHHTLRR